MCSKIRGIGKGRYLTSRAGPVDGHSSKWEVLAYPIKPVRSLHLFDFHSL